MFLSMFNFVYSIKDQISQYNLSSIELFKRMVDDEILAMFPVFSKMLKIFACLPINSCEAERSFSTLRRVKSYLRTTMGQSRLRNLAIMNIERETVVNVVANEMDKLVDMFGSSKRRDMLFF